jgi:transcriptional regulator of NAD metabolism
VPAGLSGVTSIAAGTGHNLALKSDGTVVAWGDNSSGQINVPAGLSGVTSIAAGSAHSLALKSDGTVVAWGNNSTGQINVPVGLSGVTAIAAGVAHSMALTGGGRVFAWGQNNAGQLNVPTALPPVISIAAGMDHSLALVVQAETVIAAHLDASVSSRASQETANQILGAVNQLDTAMDQAGIRDNSLESLVRVLNDIVTHHVKAPIQASLDASVSSRASQETANQILGAVSQLDAAMDQAGIRDNSLESLVRVLNDIVTHHVKAPIQANLDASISSRASEATVNAILTKVADLDLSPLNQAIGQRASQVSVELLQTGVTGLLTSDSAVHSKLDALADDLSTLEAAMNANEAKAEAFRDLNLRAQIEADLAAGAARERIAQFYLPSSVGGQLDFVRDIVADNIQLHKTAGLGIGKAEAEFAKGGAHQSAQKYRDAYDQYRKAYLELIR